MTDSQKRALGAIVRSMLLLAFGYLTQHKMVDGTIMGEAVNDLTAQIVGWIGAGATIGWSLFQKFLVSHKIKTALVLPPGTTEKQLDAVVKKTSPGILPGPIPSPSVAAAIVEETTP